MKLTPIRTAKIIAGSHTLTEFLDQFIPPLHEGSIVAITSKVVAICEGRVAPMEGTDKDELIEREADLILPRPKESTYGITLTVKRNILMPTAGIDESNANGMYVLWPEDPQRSANEIRAYLRKRFRVKDLGVVITDSKTSPLRRGTTGVCIAHSGFQALKDYVGKPDLFDRELKVTKANMADALAIAAVLVMGEGNEQTPIALIEEVPFVEFMHRNPSVEELKRLYIHMDYDLYGPLLMAAPWRKGKGGKKGRMKNW